MTAAQEAEIVRLCLDDFDLMRLSAKCLIKYDFVANDVYHSWPDELDS